MKMVPVSRSQVELPEQAPVGQSHSGLQDTPETADRGVRDLQHRTTVKGVIKHLS